MNASLFVKLAWFVVALGYAVGAWMVIRDFTRIWAIARHTFTEALRSKILFVIGLFTLVLICSSPFFPTLLPKDRVPLVTSVSMHTISLFIFIVAIFISASSLPRDIENHAIYTIVTKPVRRSSIFLGKTLGFLMLAFLVLAGMGAISYGFVWLTARSLPPETRAQVMMTRRLLDPNPLYGFQDYGFITDNDNVWIDGAYQSKIVFTFPELKPSKFRTKDWPVRFYTHIKSQTKDNTIPVEVTVRNEVGRESGPFRFELKEGQWAEVPLRRGVVVGAGVVQIEFRPQREGDLLAMDMNSVVLYGPDGKEKAEGPRYVAKDLRFRSNLDFVVGKTPRKVVWIFRHIKPYDRPKDKGRGVLETFISSKDEESGPVYIWIINPTTHDRKRIELKAENERPSFFDYDASFIDDQGRIRIELARKDLSCNLLVKPEDLKLYGAPASFALNFVKNLTLIFLQVSLLVAVSVMGSAFLSAPVSVLLAVFILFSGNVIQFMQDFSQTALRQVEEHATTPKDEVTQLLETTGVVDSQNLKQPKKPGKYEKRSLEIGIRVFTATLNTLSRLLPDFRKFQVTQDFLAGKNISWTRLWEAVRYASIYFLVFCVLGILSLMTREIQ